MGSDSDMPEWTSIIGIIIVIITVVLIWYYCKIVCKQMLSETHNQSTTPDGSTSNNRNHPPTTGRHGVWTIPSRNPDQDRICPIHHQSVGQQLSNDPPGFPFRLEVPPPSYESLFPDKPNEVPHQQLGQTNWTFCSLYIIIFYIVWSTLVFSTSA